MTPTLGLLLGRANELDVLERQYVRAAAGTPAAVLVSGEPGIGKTSLLRSFCAAHPDADVRWLSGVESESMVPFGVLAPLGLEAESTDPFVVGAEMIDRLGRSESPLVVVVDDLHWADPASVAALQFALRRLRVERVLVLASTRRVDAIADDARRAFDRLGPELSLLGLDEHAVAELAGPGVSRAVVRRLRDQTRGNPLHMLAVIGERGSELRQADGETVPVPASYEEVVLRRLRELDARTILVLHALAVLGGLASLTTLRLLTDLAGHEIAALAAGVPDLVSATPAALAFVHPLARASVYQQIPVPDRADLHLRAAGLSTGTDGLRHRLAAASSPDAGLAAQAVAAGRAFAVAGDHLSAGLLFGRAADLAADPGTAEQALLLRLEAGIRIGDGTVVEALVPFAEALAPSPLRDLVLGALATDRGDRAGAVALLERAHAACRPGIDDLLAVQIAGTLAIEMLNDGRAADCIAWSEAALALPAPAELRAMPRSLLAQGHAQLGDLRRGLASVADLAASPVLVDLEQLGALLGRGIVRLWADELPGAARDLAAVERRAATAGPLYVRLVALVYSADVLYRIGEWDRASTNAELAASLAASSGDRVIAAFAAAYATAPAAGRGWWSAAESYLAAARAASETLNDIASTAWTSLAAARLGHACGDDDAVIEALEGWWPLRAHPGVLEPGIARWTDLYAEALVRRGELDRAEEILDLADACARRRGHRTAAAVYARVRGDLLAARGAPADRVEPAYRAGREVPGLDGVLGSLAYGRWLRVSGRTAEAVPLLREAFDRAGVLAATPYVDRCTAELAACGHDAEPPPDVRALLTPQELAVCTLVATGLSNREVAVRLVVSVKTVEYHLGNAYRKAGVSSRSALTALLHGVRPSPRR